MRHSVPSRGGFGPMSGFGTLLVVAVLLLVGVPAVFQDSLIYFPDQPPLAAVLADARRHGLAAWPGEDDYRGLLRDAHGPARGTVVLFHGNAGQAGDRAEYASALAGLGLRVILAEYPAYGPRAGTPGETVLVADAAQTLALVRREFPGPLLLAGESLGAGVAAAVAKTSKVDALLLITPWDTIEHVARHHYPWLRVLPAGWLLRDRYDSVANLAGYRGRVGVAIAGNDSIVPPELGHALFDTLPEPKRLWIVAAADHNDWLGRVDAAWWRTVTDFLL